MTTLYNTPLVRYHLKTKPLCFETGGRKIPLDELLCNGRGNYLVFEPVFAEFSGFTLQKSDEGKHLKKQYDKSYDESFEDRTKKFKKRRRREYERGFGCKLNRSSKESKEITQKVKKDVENYKKKCKEKRKHVGADFYHFNLKTRRIERIEAKSCKHLSFFGNCEDFTLQMFHVSPSSCFSANNKGPEIKELLENENYDQALDICKKLSYNHNDYYAIFETGNFLNGDRWSYVIVPTKLILENLSDKDPREVCMKGILKHIVREEEIDETKQESNR